MGSETTKTGGSTGASRAAPGPEGRTAARSGRKARGVKPANGKRAESAKAEARPAMVPPPVDADRLAPAKVRPSRHEREFAEARAQEIDDVCAAWAAIVAERIAADQIFAETFEEYQTRPRDLRGLFLWDALHAAESHVTLVNSVIARHLEGRRADPFAILAELRTEQRRVAVVYAVNAFLAVLNQMSPRKAKWLPIEDLDPRMAVLALAHQSMGYALEAARIEAPADLTEHILRAAQDESVWTGARDERDQALAACAASAAFFRALDADELSTIDEIVALYETRTLTKKSAKAG